MTWVAENGLDTSIVEVVEIDPLKEDYGLRCRRFDIKEGELIMEIPRKIMMTNEIRDKNHSFGNNLLFCPGYMFTN